MSPEILTILGMTATILVAIGAMFMTLRSDMHRLEDKMETRFEGVDTKIDNLRTEVKEEISDLRTEVKEEINGLREAQHGLDTRMAGLEGLMQGLKEAIVARAAA